MAIKHFKTTGSTNGSGLVTISVTVPGTFNGIVPGSNGRIIVEAQIGFFAGALGDYVTNIIVSDPSGVIPAGMQPAFPNYPLIQSRMDLALPSNNQGLLLLPNVFTQLLAVGQVFIPSGLVLSADLQAIANRSDTGFANIYWDDGL